MSKRKGLNTDEKKTRLLELFYEKKDFFQVKELEKMAPKEKGIITQSVKDILQILVDEGLVDTDKIGTSVYYWAYPITAKRAKTNKLHELNLNFKDINEKFNYLKESLKNAKLDRENSEARKNTLKEISKLRKIKMEVEEKKKKDQKYNSKTKDCLLNDILIIKNAANKWTDNIYIIKSWCKNKFAIPEKLFNLQFEILSDFDYLD